MSYRAHYELRAVSLDLETRSQEFDWMEDSSCRSTDVDEEAFHEDASPTFSIAMENYRMALGTCEGCPVRMTCLEFGLKDENLEHGILGGRLPVERRQLAGRLRTRKAHGQTLPTKDEDQLMHAARVIRAKIGSNAA